NRMQPLLMARLTAPIAAVSLILLAIAIGAAWYIRTTQQAVTGLLANHITSVRAAQEMETNLQQIQVLTYQEMADGKVRLEPILGYRARSDQHLASAEEFAQTTEEQALMVQVRQGYEKYWTQYE